MLVVGGDPDTLRSVRRKLEHAGYPTVVTGDPGAVPRLDEKARPDLVLLDVALSGKEGIELMEETLGARQVPVFFLTPDGLGETMTMALEKGAIDYVVKPVSATELAVRVRAALAKRTGGGGLLTLGDLAIDCNRRRVTLAGRALDLTATEFDLLRELAVNAGQVLSHEVLLRRVWFKGDSSDVGRVHVCINRLRYKLGDRAQSPTYIFSVRGVGYRMAKLDQG